MNMGHLTTCKTRFQFSVYQFDAVDLKQKNRLVFIRQSSRSTFWVRKP